MSLGRNTRNSMQAFLKLLFAAVIGLSLSGCGMSSRIESLIGSDVFEITGAPTINLGNKTSVVFTGKCAGGMTSFEITEPAPVKTVSCGADRNWSVEFDFSSKPDGQIKIVTDYINPTTGANFEFEVLKDTQPPDLKLRSDVSGETNLSSIPVDVDFSEPVTGFSESDVSVDNGVVTSLSGSGTSYRLYIQPQAQGPVTVDIANNIARDLAGNMSSTVSGPLTFVYDGTRPSVVLSSLESNPTNNSSISVTVTFSEDVVGLVPADFVVTGAVLLTVNGSGSIYQLTLTSLISGLVQLQLPIDRASDVAGNGNSASNILEITYDNHNPIPTLSSLVTSPSNVTVIPVAVHFDKAVNGINASDFIVTNGTISDLTGSGSSYTFNLTPTSEGTVEVSLPAAVTQSPVGNTNAASNTLSIVIDRTPGSLSISNPSPASGNAATNFVWTLTYSDYDVITLTNADIDLVATGNVVCSNKTVTSPTASTRAVTVSGCTGSGTVALDVDAGTAKDTAGNLFASSSSSTATVSNPPPTITIGAPSPLSGGSATNFTWSVTYTAATTVTLSAANVVLHGDTENCGGVTVTGAGMTKQVKVSGCTNVGSLAISIAAGTAIGTGGTAAASTVSTPAILTNQVLVSFTDLVSVVDKNASGTSSQSFLLSLNKVFSKDVEISYDLVEAQSTATNPLHHNIQKGSVLIPAGQTTASIEYQYNDGTTVGSKFVQVALIGTSEKVVGINQSLSRRLVRDLDALDAEYISMSAGGYHTCAVKNGGGLWCWGNNAWGQLGNNSSTDSFVPVLAGSGFANVRAGTNHTCALKSDGELYCWGANGSGQLGNNSTMSKYVPTLIGSGYESVSAGNSHTCALQTDGELLCWGSNSYGQLGNNSATNSSTPVSIGSGYASVSTGASHTCAVKSDGELWCWGNNASGQLGNSSTTNSSTPVSIGSGYASVSTGASHTCAVKSDGELWCWGNNGSGRLGNNSVVNSSVPVLVGSGYIRISAGDSHTCAVKSGGGLYCWGSNDSGRLGNNSTISSSVPLSIGSGYTSVSVGNDHSCAMKTGGDLYCWGRDVYGQLNNNSTKNSRVPVSIGSGYAGVSSGESHSCAVKSDGVLFCWGSNDYGRLGNNSMSNSSVPVSIGSGYAAVSASVSHTCAVKSDGELLCWGAGSRLGNSNSGTNSLAPILVGNGYINVNAGGSHTCAVKSDGELWCWGNNGSGQLGNNSTTTSSVPILIGNGYASVDAGEAHTCSVKSDGELWCWGNNGSGRLGNNSTVSSSVPVLIGSGYANVSAGGSHTCAVKTDGDLYCWGSNGYGQLGKSGANSFVPLLIGSGYANVSAGANHTCAVKTDGELYCWGNNGSGELGSNSGNNSSVPVLIGSGYANVSAGANHTCAVKSDGKLQCWGAGTQLGDGSISPRIPSIVIP
ncbi:Ig-like domain-containing protein [Bdellovibrio sp.]|uniref:RCC1 domain-containing protein n=1 Tax=Bdellovibrio sp. TaxID=28201 RepID=UPI0039E26883